MNKNTAIVTGAGRGIGRGIALALAERGWGMTVNYRGNATAAAETLEMVHAAGGQGLVVQANIAEANGRKHLVAETIAKFGRIDLLVNNAGMGMMTALFADRLAGAGINVYEIRPGVIETDMTEGAKEKYNHLIADGLTPIQRWGQPDDIARAVVALAEGSFPFSTGEIINVDGGFHLRRL
jgi:NAD(P)-dependent dehydrogenase (short-subunit alcohol dehydrogenase family)